MPPDTDSRYRQLVQACIALSSELSLDALLETATATAAAVTGARYAALGVLDPTGTSLERFVTVGVDERTRATIGAPPHGRGVLGALIADAVPLRLHRLEDDPRSVGFPPGHPPMRTFLGVPVLLRGVAYGNLYLTEKEDGEDFTDEDEELVTLLARQAAVAIENTRLYESAMTRLTERESVDAIANEFVREPELRPLLALVGDTVRHLTDARVVHVWLPSPEGPLQLEAAAGATVDAIVGVTRTDDAKLFAVLARGRTERIDSVLEDPEIDQGAARRAGVTAALYVPLLVRNRAVGAIAVYDKSNGTRRFDEHDVRLVESLATRAAVAVELRQRLSRETVRSMLAAQENERRRIARELHDETGQALTSILLALKQLERTAGEEAIAPVRDLVGTALAEVRRLAVELRPSVLDDFGLVPALERLVERRHDGLAIEVATSLEPGERLPGEYETALYRIAQEALTNAAKYAGPCRVVVRLGHDDRSIVLSVADDGVGFAQAATPTDRYGLTGIRERVELLGGTLAVDAAPGRGVRLRAALPLPGVDGAADEPAVAVRNAVP